MDPKAMAAMDPKTMAALMDPKAMSDPKLFGALSGMDPKMLAGIDPKMLAGLDPKMAAGLDPKMLAGLDPKMLAGLDPKSLDPSLAAMYGLTGLPPTSPSGAAASSAQQNGLSTTSTSSPTPPTTASTASTSSSAGKGQVPAKPKPGTVAAALEEKKKKKAEEAEQAAMERLEAAEAAAAAAAAAGKLPKAKGRRRSQTCHQMALVAADPLGGRLVRERSTTTTSTTSLTTSSKNRQNFKLATARRASHRRSVFCSEKRRGRGWPRKIRSRLRQPLLHRHLLRLKMMSTKMRTTSPLPCRCRPLAVQLTTASIVRRCGTEGTTAPRKRAGPREEGWTLRRQAPRRAEGGNGRARTVPGPPVRPAKRTGLRPERPEGAQEGAGWAAAPSSKRNAIC